ncbi:allantoate amidohydrolase [Nesterenkonia halophila]
MNTTDSSPTGQATTVTGLMADIAGTGRDAMRGGYSRPVFSSSELELRSWFVDQAVRRGLDVTTDRNGVLWAWWDRPDGDRRNALVTGSHLDSVPGGGAFDGPLGVASAFVAVDRMRAQGTAPGRAVAIAVFPEEEGSRFGVACLGSRLMTGAIDVDRARNLKDEDGRTLAEVCAARGLDPEHLGRDDEVLATIGQFVELHVEQGRGLIDLDAPVAVGSSILGHGRWRISLRGQGNHAGTTLMTDRRDPLVATAQIIADIRQVAREQDGARATVGRLQPVPGGTNVIASQVDLWMDVRHPDDAVTARLVETIGRRVHEAAAHEGCEAHVTEESLSPTVSFDAGLSSSLSTVLPGAPVLDTGAGHDAGVLARDVPTAMLFVRNPTGISHSPEEHVEDDDSEVGALKLAEVLTHLSS